MLVLIRAGITEATPSDYRLHSPLARELSSHNGLSQSTITSMAEDQQGRFWIGTLDGVNIVDGNSIRLLSHDQSKGSLSGKVISSMVADKNSAIWVATTKGLDRVNTLDFSVTAVYHNNQPLSGIAQMLLLDSRYLAIVLNHKLLLLNLLTNEVTDDPFFADSVQTIGVASTGIVLKTSSGFFHYTTTAKPIKLAVPEEFVQATGNYLLTEQTLWLITKDFKVMRCESGSCRPFALPAPTHQVQSLQMTLDKGSLYFVRDEQIIVYSLEEQSFRLIFHQLAVHSYIARGSLVTLKVLRSGDIAIGGYRGLLLVPDQYRDIISYPQLSHQFNKGIYALKTITGDRSGQDKLLIATEDGLELYRFEKQHIHLEQQILYPQKMTAALILRIRNELLLSTLNHGVYRIDLATKQLTRWQPELEAMSGSDSIIDVLQLDDNYFILLFHQKLVLVKYSQERYIQQWSVKIPTTKTAKIAWLDQHLVIAAYQQGVLTSQWTHWSTPPEQWHAKADGNPVLDLRLISANTLQMMTAEQGVQLLHIKNGQVKIEELASTSQLLNKTTVCSAEFADHYWAASTHDGLALFSPDNQLVRTLTLYDGLIQKEFNQYLCGQINGKTYFAGDQGLSLVDHATPIVEHPATLQFTHLLVDNHSTSLHTNSITLTEPNTILLNFSYAPYPVMAPVRFQYRLKPGNDEWAETTSTTLRYTQLSPGHYNLHLRAVRFDGTLSAPIQLNLQIKPLFWHSPQAYILYCLTVIFILWLLFRQRWQIQQAKLHVAESQRQFQQEYTDKLEEAVRLRTVKLEQQQQEFLALQQEKVQFVATTSHDLKNLSALIQLNLADLNKYVQPIGQASWQNVHSSCTLLNTLVDDILELSKLNAGIVTPALQAVNLPNLLQQVCQPFKPMAEERQIDLQLRINEELMVLTDPYLLARLLMNLLDNALKNLSPGHTVQLELKKRYRTSRQVYLLVRDSGPGMPEHMRRHWGLAFQRGASGYQGTGLGLNIVKKIAELLVLPVSLYSSDRGTCFELRFQQSEPQDQQTTTVLGHAAIIESDPQARQFLYYELVRHGFKVAVFNDARDFSRSGQTGFKVLISDIHFNATDDSIADLALFRSSLDNNGKLIFVSTEANVRSRLPEQAQLYFMLKPVKRSRLAWLLAKEP